MREPDDPRYSDVLPLPELNPLLNPILGRNMGRWAEVYFTNPPERREQAVGELLRELEADEARTPSRETVREPVFSLSESSSEPFAAEEASSDLLPAECSACGRANRSAHRFCGYCGASLPAAPGIFGRLSATNSIAIRTTTFVPLSKTLSDSPTPSAPSSDSPSSDSQANQPFASFTPQPTARESAIGQYSERALKTIRSWRLRIGFYSWKMKAVLVAQPNRNYAIAAIAFAFAAGALLALRHNFETSPPTVTSSASASETTAQNVSLPSFSATYAATAQAKPSPAATVKNVAHFSPTKLPTSAANHSLFPSSVTTPVPTPDEAAQATSATGSQELATARTFLGGNKRTGPNTAEASIWLWKAVRKQNAEATMLLANLYLKGDGVPKDCDQARLLLDAAAARKRKDAADLLQNMAAFGCQ